MMKVLVKAHIPAALAAASLLALAAMLFFAASPRDAMAQEEPPVQQSPEEGPPMPPPQTESFVMQLYFYKDGELVGAPRSNIPGGGQMVEFAVKDLLEGPTEEEREQGYRTYIPQGVKLMYSTKSMVGSSYAVNLSGELMQLAGDREAASLALRQIVRTLREAAHTDDVRITVNISENEREVDAFQALGVNPAEAGLASVGEGGKGSLLWLYLLIILGAVLLAEAALVPLFVRARRRERAFGQSGDAGGIR